MALPPKNFTATGGVQVTDSTTLEISLASTARSIIEALPASAVVITGNTTLTQATHQGKLLYCAEATPGTPQNTTLTVDGSTGFEDYASCTIYAAAGVTVIVSGSGVTVNAFDGKALRIDPLGFGQLLREPTAGPYILTAEQAFAAALGALSDVDTTGAANGKILRYNGTTWVVDDEASVSAATTSAAGIVELATDGENAANVVVQGNDSRLSNARTPTAHAASHGSGQPDAITLAQSQVTNLTTDLAALAPVPSNRRNTSGNAVDLTTNVLYGGSGQTLTLPAVATTSILTVVNRSGNSWTIARSGSDLIEGATSETLTNGKSVSYYYNGANTWGRIGALT